MNDRNSLILGAFLHDTGKFYQRTRKSPFKYEDTEQEIYGYSGAHAKWSASFIEQYVPPALKNEKVIGTALHHHKPKNELEKYVQKADWLSAGMDRKDREEKKDAYTTPLSCLLEKISLQKGNKKYAFSHRLRKLSLKKEDIFPVDSSKNHISSGSYSDLWAKFTGEAEKLIKLEDFREYFFSLYHLMKKYTWCVPGAVYKSVPDIPLFHHLKTTAAIATCLYDTKGEEKFIFLEGDISGIQSFIYSISSPQEAMKGTSKRLRGRSFYLSLLNETFADYCLDILDLTIVNKLWCGGGHFAILAPFSKENVEKLEAFEKKINTFLLREFHGSLGFALGSLVITSDGLKEFSSTLKDMAKVLDEKKKRKFFDQITSKSSPVFPLEDDVCHICAKDSSSGICPLCETHEALGQKLPVSTYLYKINHPDNKKAAVSFSEFNTYWDFKPASGRVFRYSLNNTDMIFDDSETAGNKGFMLIGNYVPKEEDGDIKTFDRMASSSEGANFLGILRMDVDDLGRLFSQGFGENKSISRVASMSFNMDLFFSGYLNTICEDLKKEGKENLYITYSGGDDLFIVGAWNEVIEVARKINSELYEYTGRNDEIHASGGIFLCKGKYPIARAAKKAEDFLDKAKEVKGKNSINIFGCNIPCSRAEEVYSFSEELLNYLDKEKISVSFLRNTLNLFQEESLNLSAVPKFHYSLKRNIKDYAIQLSLKDRVISLRDWISVWAGISLLKIRN